MATCVAGVIEIIGKQALIAVREEAQTVVVQIISVANLTSLPDPTGIPMPRICSRDRVSPNLREGAAAGPERLR